MKTVFSIATLVQFYCTNLINCNSFLAVQDNYVAISQDTNTTINILNTYIPSIAPINFTKQKRISSEFGSRYHPIQHRVIFHQGIDVAAKYGTPVHSTAAGLVVYIKNSSDGYGKEIEMLHEFGFQTKYAHLYTIMVEENQYIKKGEVIGFVGSTGSSTGPHLHYEVIKNKKKIDPQPFFFLDNNKAIYDNENNEFVNSIESRIDSVIYPGETIPKLSEPIEIQNLPVIKVKRRDGSESFGNME